MNLTATAAPIFLTKNYANRDVILAGGTLTASSMQELVDRIVDMDPFATWNSGGSVDGTVETLDVALYVGITQTTRADIALIALLNINFKDFTIQLSDDGGLNFHTVYTVANHTEDYYVVDCSAAVKSANHIRITATNVQTTADTTEKVLGTVVVAGLLKQLATQPNYPMKRELLENTRILKMSDGSENITYVKRSAASYEFNGLALDFRFMPKAELDDIKAIRRESPDFLFYADPYEFPLEIYYCRFKGVLSAKNSNAFKGHGYDVGFSVREIL